MKIPVYEADYVALGVQCKAKMTRERATLIGATIREDTMELVEASKVQNDGYFMLPPKNSHKDVPSQPPDSGST